MPNLIGEGSKIETTKANVPRSESAGPGLLPSFPNASKCIRCGLCLSVCPTYREEAIETSSPRGRLNILKAWVGGKLKTSRNLNEQIYRCLGCQACSAICPSGVKIDELVLEGRAAFDKDGLTATSRRYLLENLNLECKKLHWASFLLRLYQTLGIQTTARSLGILKLLPKNLREAESLIPKVGSKPLTDLLPEMVPAQGEKKGRVGYFIGCVNNFILPEVGQATVRVLSSLGYEVVMPRGMGCCGMPSRAYGEGQITLELAQRNIRLFQDSGAEAVITDCATCGHTLKEYAHLLEQDAFWAREAKSFSSKVKDINEFLAPLKLPLKQPVEGVVTYHDPCHLARGQGKRTEPRELLKRIPGIRFVEMAESDWCCGSAGSYLLTHPDLSLAILKRKMDNIRATGASLIATSCPACQMQLRLGARRFGPEGARVVHPIVLIAQSMGLIPAEERVHATV